jgi:hypothetical protein
MSISRPISRLIHPIAGALATLTIASFQLATLASETLGTHAQIATIKHTIAWGLLLLIPLMTAAGGSGFALAKGALKGRIAKKAKRMRIIAANGLLVLVPAALFLHAKAHAAQFDTAFYAVQALELLAGLVNLTLMLHNMRDGLALRPARHA